ncbi:MAG: thrombospondin type 3 repeat-containing protein [Deltaproteobacteria bacterium]|nr:thrombospondin type 3 repeat-containing protein [Deltaproteobacteria bacterium]
MALDRDGDGFADLDDNCLEVANPAQIDVEFDGIGNACDPDYNNDGAVSGLDWGLYAAAFGSSIGDDGYDPRADHDGDDAVSLADFAIFVVLFGGPPGPSGIDCAGTVGCVSCGRSYLVDADDDEVADSDDNCIEHPNGPGEASNQIDSDSDGYGNACDADYDNDGEVTDWDGAAMLQARSDPSPHPRFDHNGDGVVNIADSSIFDQLKAAAQLGPSGLVCPRLADLPMTDDSTIDVIKGEPFTGFLLDPPPLASDGLTFSVTAEAKHGVVKIIDHRTGAYRYDAPATSEEFDSFSWRVARGLSISSENSVGVQVWDEQGGSEFVAGEFSDNALVVYNVNGPEGDAVAIAQHYASARGVPSANLCPVAMPTGLYASKDEFLSLREQVVECICQLAGSVPSCGIGELAALAEASPISHLVLVRGLPARLYDTGWTQDVEEPPLDHYLAYLIYNEEGELFGEDDGVIASSGHDYSRHCESAADCVQRKDLSPAFHRVAAHGRIEAMTRQRTLDLIDRTLEAEAQGFRGNLLSGFLDIFDQHRKQTADFAPVCTDYLVHEPFVAGAPESTWPFDECRAGTAASEARAALTGAFPGETDSSIPLARNAGLYLHDFLGEGNIIGQSGFDGFGKVKKFEIADCAGAPLCTDPTCEGLSTDYFRELDTRCVGVAPGFLGWQTRSFAVRGYGFFPAGWGNGCCGNVETTIPVVEPTGGADADGRYVHFGAHSVANPDVSQCGGSPCPERIFVKLVAGISNPPLVQDGRVLAVRLHKRHPGNAAGAALRVGLLLDGVYLPAQSLSLEAETPSWSPAPELQFVLPNTGEPVGNMAVNLTIENGSGSIPVHGHLDLDAIDVVDLSTTPETPLLPEDQGHFSRTDHRVTHTGDYAATAIDRLGGIAWWGSSSHFKTDGWAFSGPAENFPGMFFAGKTLGETIASTDDRESGLFYGDPLYRASAANLFIPGDSHVDGRTAQPWTVDEVLWPAAPTIGAADHDRFDKIWVDAMHGSANLATVQWEISACRRFNVNRCDVESTWTTVGPPQTGSAKALAYDWLPLIDPAVSGPVTLRLRVWNGGELEHALHDFVYLYWWQNSLP